MKILRFLASLCAMTLLATLAVGQEMRVRREVRIPDIPGYRTVKCDLHIHTVFSDGTVWPNVRSEEAWREGLDAIAITDHIEYQPHADDLPTSHDRAFEIARPHGDRLAVTVIRGSEVTRDMPPGHLNAVFLRSSVPLDTKEWRDALEEANEQGAFIFWNHPGWTGQQPDFKGNLEEAGKCDPDTLHLADNIGQRSDDQAKNGCNPGRPRVIPVADKGRYSILTILPEIRSQKHGKQNVSTCPAHQEH